MSEKNNTIVVGAGIAGMTCALKLQEMNIPYTVISENVGGRICYLDEYEMNFGAVFYMKGYRYTRQILTPLKKVLPSYFDLECHGELGRGYGVLSPEILGSADELVGFIAYLKEAFEPSYAKYKRDCETMDVPEAMEANPYIAKLFQISADELVRTLKIEKTAKALVSQFVYACTGTQISELNGLDYLVCAMGIIDDATRFTFDSADMAKRLAEGTGSYVKASVVSVAREDDGWCITTSDGATFRARNLVMASPADVTQRLLEPVLGTYEIRDASKLYAYKVKGKIKNDYAGHDLHLFDQSIPLINIGARPDGMYEVFTCKPLDMGIFFDKFEIVHREDWEHALFTHPSIILKQDIGNGLYRIGDHNALGLEPAAISGIFAANRIAQSEGIDITEPEQTEELIDKNGNPAPGPSSYDNIDEQGNVLYLDEQRLRRKERPWKAQYVNHPRGLGIKDLLVTNLSARDWNWQFILWLFRQIVAGSALMKKPDTWQSKLYKHAMLFEPMESTYSTGAIFNLNVDSPEDIPGTAGYNAEHLSHPADEEPYACPDPDANFLTPKKRVAKIEIGKSFDARKTTVPIDLVKKAIAEADYIGGMKECLCRAGNDCQTYPHDLACLFLNMGGRVVVEHGMAVELTKEQAFERVDRAAELGLPCQSLWVEIEQLIWGFRNDQMDQFLEICFCCPCCCVGFNLSKNATRDVKHRFSPSGWTAVVNHDLCTGCRKCSEQYCPQDAIHYRKSDGKMVVDQENCVGCGFCRAKCPNDAIELLQTMPMRESMHDYFLKEGKLKIV